MRPFYDAHLPGHATSPGTSSRRPSRSPRRRGQDQNRRSELPHDDEAVPPAVRLAAVDEEHTTSGAHRTTEIPFPDWVPVEELNAAALLTVDDALAQLPPCLR
jgi:hypothetical protein